MEYSLARNWWILAVRGVLAIVFGALAFVWPTLAWIVVVASFAAYALVDGIFAIAAAISGHGAGRRWWALVIQGILGISAGVLTFFWPGLTQLALLFLIAYWAIATGVFEVIAAIRLRKEIQGEWLLALSGVLSVIYGLALIIMPVAGAIAVAWLIAAFSVASGVIMLVLAFRLREFAGNVRAVSPAAGGKHVPVH
jgi:uncharacterized membrane protein HdeD (DUF308 family)